MRGDKKSYMFMSDKNRLAMWGKVVTLPPQGRQYHFVRWRTSILIREGMESRKSSLGEYFPFPSLTAICTKIYRKQNLDASGNAPNRVVDACARMLPPMGFLSLPA